MTASWKACNCLLFALCIFVSLAELIISETSHQISKIHADSDTVPWMQQVGLHPRVYYYHNFLTEAERTHMIRLAAPQMRRSVVSGAHGEGVVDNIRTSYGMFIKRLQDPVIEHIERRISLITRIPISHQEDMQVLRYTTGQKYGAHYDSAYDNEESGPHHRLATFYMYLSDVEDGGETAFPEQSEWYDPAMGARADPTFSDCAKGHVAAKPKAGDAVLFYSFFPNKTMDPASMHTGCPVIKGIKWGSPVWIHVDQFNPEDYQRSAMQRPELPHEPGMCEDLNPQCREWAMRGECEHSPVFMVGDAEMAGNCRLSCHACEVCGPTEWACIHRNRKAAGYLELSREEMQWLGVPWWMGDDTTGNEQ